MAGRTCFFRNIPLVHFIDGGTLKMILVYDTETTGLAKLNLSPSDPRQPYLVQIAAILFDKNGKEIASMSAIIKPNGWKIPKEIAKIHGISTQRATREGIDLPAAVGMFLALHDRATVTVAHNKLFDQHIMEAAIIRASFEKYSRSKNKICTMEMAKPIIKHPPTAQMIEKKVKGYKNPRLSECFAYFFNEDLENAHDALVDTRSCAKIYFEMLKNHRPEKEQT